MFVLSLIFYTYVGGKKEKTHTYKSNYTGKAKKVIIYSNVKRSTEMFSIPPVTSSSHNYTPSAFMTD